MPFEAGNLLNQNVESIRTAFASLLEVLQWLHQNGTAHGAVSTSALTFDDYGNLKLDNFGLAGLARSLGEYFDPSHDTAFVAPELSQLDGGTPRGDLYSSGVALYRCLTGRIPQGIFEMPSEINPGIGKHWDELIVRALQGAPEKRFETAAEFQKALTTPVTSPSKIKMATGSQRSVPARETRPVSTQAQARTGVGTETTRVSDDGFDEPSGRGGLWIALACIVLGAVGFAAYQMLKPGTTPLPEQKRYAESVDSGSRDVSTSDGEPEMTAAEIRDAEAAERLYRISAKLVQLRSLIYHCPNLQRACDANLNLKTLVVYADHLHEIADSRDNREPADFLMSEEFEGELDDLWAEAVMEVPERPIRSGKFIVWGKEANSEEEASSALSDFSGNSGGTLSLTGDLNSGLALNEDGTVSSWGVSPPLSDTTDINFVDHENGTSALLDSNGTPFLIHSDGSTIEPEESWKNIARIRAGDGHIIALTSDFKVLIAGDTSAGQADIPVDIVGKRIVAVEAIGKKNFALSAEGDLYNWGDNTYKATETIYLPFSMTSTGRNLIVRSLNGEITHFDHFNTKTSEAYDSDKEKILMVQYSPNDELFAKNTGSSRWILEDSGDSGIEPAYWQETSRGAIDLILGAERFAAIVPRANISSTKKTSQEKETRSPSVELVSVDGIPVPTSNTFREWSPKQGRPRRARVLELKDGTHVTLKFSNGEISTIPLSRLSDKDAEFVTTWKSATELMPARVDQELRKLTQKEILKFAGYEAVDFLVKDGYPYIKVVVDSIKSDLIIDTGATGTLLSANLAIRANLSLKENFYINTWQGRVLAQTANVKELELGEFGNYPLKVMVSEAMGEKDGLLGLNFLKQSRAAFDFGKSRLLIHTSRPVEEVKDELEPKFRNWGPDSDFRAKLSRYYKSKIEVELPDGEKRDLPRNALGDYDHEYIDLWREHARVEAAISAEIRQLSLEDYFAGDSQTWSKLKVSLQNNTQVVSVTLEGRAFEFFVDTGAPKSMLSIKSARSLGYHTGNMQAIGMVGGIEGNELPVFSNDFGSLQIGGKIFHDYRLHVYDFEHMTESRYTGTAFDGVIGCDLLIRLGAIIDVKDNRILYPTG